MVITPILLTLFIMQDTVLLTTCLPPGIQEISNTAFECAEISAGTPEQNMLHKLLVAYTRKLGEIWISK